MTTVVEVHPCVGCGLEIERDLPTDDGFWRRQMLRCIRCPDCESLAKAEAEADLERSRLEDQNYQRRLRESDCGLPAALRNLSWSELDTTGVEAAVASAIKWAEHGGGLVLSGPVGVGKTRLAATACWDALGFRPCRWLSTPALFARLSAGMGSDVREGLLKVLIGRTALCLDDLDKARATEYGAEQVFLAVDSRIGEGEPLLVTTNLSLGELAAKFPEPYGEAIASRLAGYCEVVTLDGEDRRTA